MYPVYLGAVSGAGAEGKNSGEYFSSVCTINVREKRIYTLINPLFYVILYQYVNVLTNKWRKTEHAKRKKEGISRRGTSHRWL